MKKKISLSLISFAYTLLFGFVLDGDIFIHDFVFMIHKVIYGKDIVSSSHFTNMTLLFCTFLLIGVILFTILQFERIKGFFIYIYLSSLLASFLLALFFDGLTSGGFISLPWSFVGVVLFVYNILVGPAMVFLLCYFIVKYKKRHNNQPRAY